MNPLAKKLIDSLELVPHPEGGYFRETYRHSRSLLLEDRKNRTEKDAGWDRITAEWQLDEVLAGSGDSSTVKVERSASARALSTSIYYLLQGDDFSVMHKLSTDELYHFYLGSSVEMLNLYEDGSSAIIMLGNDPLEAESFRPQHLVPAGTWQGSRLLNKDGFALLGTTMSPGFDFQDYEEGRESVLAEIYPERAELIARLCHKK